MMRVILFPYIAVLGMSFCYHAWHVRVIEYLMPLILCAIPIIMKREVSIHLNLKDITLGILASALILIPVVIVLYLSGRSFHTPGTGFLIYQFIGVALPEEIYFRGFLQEAMGNNIRSIFLVSLLFSMVHLPQLIFYGEVLAPLTFFPSLIMGFLYYRTGNVLTPAVFHYLANISISTGFNAL